MHGRFVSQGNCASTGGNLPDAQLYFEYEMATHHLLRFSLGIETF
jgi:hypothetical protein